MYELPEIVTIAAQMAEALPGARIAACERGNSPHKWVWYSMEPEEYEEVLVGRTLGEAAHQGNRIVLPVEPGWALHIGDMGGKITLHPEEDARPEKRHLMLDFEDGRFLTVCVAGWGGIWLAEENQPAGFQSGRDRVDPIGDEFTYDRFKELLVDDAAQGKKRSVKAFMASEPRISGVGNGYVQDICFRARLHPKRDITTISGRERLRWYHAIRGVLRNAIEAGGRDTESDLFGEPGGYVAKMDRRALDQPCPECGTPIEKISYLGGSCYVCAQCQPYPAD
jgi:formamidopyrimidine-DNA glycosylase